MFTLDHIGIATDNLDSSIEVYEKTLGCTSSGREQVISQQVEVVFVDTLPTKIELLAPLNDSGPIQKFLQSRGPGMHHICYRVPDIQAALQHFQELGHQLIDEKPRAGAHNSQIAFVHPRSFNGVLTELCQY